jgi:hypothetical protein
VQAPIAATAATAATASGSERKEWSGSRGWGITVGLMQHTY